MGEAASGKTPGIRQSSGPVVGDTTLSAIGKPSSRTFATGCQTRRGPSTGFCCSSRFRTRSILLNAFCERTGHSMTDYQSIFGQLYWDEFETPPHVDQSGGGRCNTVGDRREYLWRSQVADRHHVRASLICASGYSTTGGNRQLQGFVSGPLGENLAGRIAVRLGDTDGFYTNRLQGPGGPNGTDTGVRMKLAWTPSDRTSVDLKLEYDQFDSEGADTAFNTGSFCPSRDQESSNVTLTIEHDYSRGTLTSISAWCIPSGPNVLAAMNPPREIGLRISADFD